MDPAPADSPLQLVFQGECLAGHDRDAVRAAVGRALKLDPRRAARLFSGRRIVLRRELDVKTAHRTIARFAAMGALLRAEPSQPRERRGASRSSRRRRAPPPRWQRVLRFAAIGVLCLVASLVVGVALGPMLGGGWSDEPGPAGPAPTAGAQPAPIDAPRPPAPAVAAPPTALIVPPPTAQIVPPPTALIVPPPATPIAPPPPVRVTPGAPGQDAGEEDPLRDLPAHVRREYTQRYLRAPDPKAFAISSGGAHGWHAGAASENEAREKAIARCLAAQRPGDDGCRIVDADGEWTD